MILLIVVSNLKLKRCNLFYSYVGKWEFLLQWNRISSMRSKKKEKVLCCHRSQARDCMEFPYSSVMSLIILQPASKRYYQGPCKPFWWKVPTMENWRDIRPSQSCWLTSNQGCGPSCSVGLLSVVAKYCMPSRMQVQEVFCFNVSPYQAGWCWHWSSWALAADTMTQFSLNTYVCHFIVNTVVQWLSCVWVSVTPWIVAHQASLSFTISQSLLKFMFIELVMLSNHLILCHPLLPLSSVFPSIRVFSIELAFYFRWPKCWSFSSSPTNEYSGLRVNECVLVSYYSLSTLPER